MRDVSFQRPARPAATRPIVLAGPDDPSAARDPTTTNPVDNYFKHAPVVLNARMRPHLPVGRPLQTTSRGSTSHPARLKDIAQIMLVQVGLGVHRAPDGHDDTD